MKKLILSLSILLCGGTLFAQLIDGAEYFWDVDPGLGNGTFISLTPAAVIDENLSISPAGLSQGPHILGIRTHSDDGTWGITRTERIVVHQYTGGEYFWVNDPGIGNGIPFDLNTTSTSVDLDLEVSFEGFPGGKRLFGIRTKGAEGVWSPTTFEQVVIPTIYSEGEYFWDTDPGVGNATSFSLENTVDTLDQDIAIDNTGISRGWHNLYTRIKGKYGSFGPAKKHRIFITRSIVGGEYFWDTDPGVGNGSPIGVLTIGSSAQVCDDIPTIGLSEGVHYLYVRTVGDDGVWSIPSRIQITVTPNENIVGCPGDLNRDGSVNSGDLIILLASFGSDGDCSIDLTGDFTVNTNDLVFFLALFGSTCE